MTKTRTNCFGDRVIEGKDSVFVGGIELPKWLGNREAVQWQEAITEAQMAVVENITPTSDDYAAGAWRALEVIVDAFQAKFKDSQKG
jgi:hypothetical protein